MCYIPFSSLCKILIDTALGCLATKNHFFHTHDELKLYLNQPFCFLLLQYNSFGGFELSE